MAGLKLLLPDDGSPGLTSGATLDGAAGAVAPPLNRSCQLCAGFGLVAVPDDVSPKSNPLDAALLPATG